jgi:hypothetical protein
MNLDRPACHTLRLREKPIPRINSQPIREKTRGVRFQLAKSEFRKLEAYATKNSQTRRESSVSFIVIHWVRYCEMLND